VEFRVHAVRAHLPLLAIRQFGEELQAGQVLDGGDPDAVRLDVVAAAPALNTARCEFY
jgi:hypothetical protein